MRKVVAYSEKWLALTSIVGENSKKIKKGYTKINLY